MTMRCMSAEFRVDSSSHFLEHGHTDRHTRSQTLLITLPTALLPVTTVVGNKEKKLK